MMKIINVSKSYKSTRALVDFTYEFGVGIYAILGPNGSGKSTLMNIITGNLAPDGGSVCFSQSEDAPQRPKIGYVPQQAAMYPYFTVYEMLDYVAILNGVDKRREHIEALMQAFDISSSRDKRIRSLSGGTRQRLAIAQGFIGLPEIVILDEPTAGLDPLQRILFKNAVKKMSADMTVIIATHIVSDVEDIADEVLFLDKGRIVKAGKLQTLLSEFDTYCWRLPKGAVYDGLTRIDGEDVRAIAPQKPIEGAVPVAATLEDYYLKIFGGER